MSETPVRGRIGTLIQTSTPPEQIGTVARAAEEAGFDEIWVAEDYFRLGGISAAAIALAATRSVSVGIGVVSAVVRHPAVLAMELATLARAFPGRLMAGIGHGAQAWMKQIGSDVPSPITALRECVTSTKALLDGQLLTEEGAYATFRAVSLTHPANSSVPVHLGVMRPKGIELAGQIADGLLTSAVSPAQFVAQARRRLDEAAAGREISPRLTVLALTCLTVDAGQRGVAREELREVLAERLARSAVQGRWPLFDPVPGLNERLAEIVAASAPGELRDTIAKTMPEEWIDLLAIAGTADDLLAGLRRYAEAGADSVLLSAAPAERWRSTFDVVAAHLDEIRSSFPAGNDHQPLPPSESAEPKERHR